MLGVLDPDDRSELWEPSGLGEYSTKTGGGPLGRGRRGLL